MKRSLPSAGAAAAPAKRLAAASATDLNSLIVAVGSTLAAALGQQGIHSLEALVSIEPEQLGPLAMGAGVTEAAIGEAQGKASAALPVSASARQTPAAAIRRHAKAAAGPAAVPPAAGSGACSLAPLLPPALCLADGELMHSTSANSASKRKWLGLTPRAQEREPTLSYCSSDGSSTGWHGCVFVPRTSDVDGAEPVAHLRAQWGDMKGTRNVGAEASGFLLGMQTVAAAPPADSQSVVFLADFLNALAWAPDVRAANYKHEVLVAVYGEVDGLKAGIRTTVSNPHPIRTLYPHPILT